MKNITLILLIPLIFIFTAPKYSELTEPKPKDPVVVKYEHYIDSLQTIQKKVKDKARYVELNDEIYKKKFELKIYQIKKKPKSELSENEKLMLELDNVEQKIQKK